MGPVILPAWPPAAERTGPVQSTVPLRSRWLVPLAFLAFVSLGLPDGVLGVAWPWLRRSFERPVDHLGLILLAVMAGRLVSSFGGGILLARLGVGRLVMASALLISASAAVWAVTPVWLPVLLGALLWGLGAGGIDAGLNAYAAAHFSPRATTWVHACWGLGAMLGPLAMTATLASGQGWRVGYAELAAAVLPAALAFWLTRGLWETPPREDIGAATLSGASLLEALGQGGVRANAVLFFFYTGVESGAGRWAYTLLTESRGMGTEAAGLIASAYWGSLSVGRLAFGALAHHVRPVRLLQVATASVPVLALLVWATRSPLGSSAALLGLGLLLAPIFPLLIAETPSRVGERHAAHAVGIQIAAATVGADTLPALVGVLMSRLGLEALGPALVGLSLLLLLLHAVRTARTQRPRGGRPA